MYSGVKYDSKFCFLAYEYLLFLAPFFEKIGAWINKLIYSSNEIPFSNKKELTIDTHTNLD